MQEIKFPTQISLVFKLITQIRHVDQQKVAWSESQLCFMYRYTIAFFASRIILLM